ncbi:uncharacterized protein LOC133520968 [Cydia pomonella]|uniref:uncharacterized protein LOC133520968 n=1 Tax=Cydia pomonella TaxID=82600 RepID=UPI002ADD4FBC|nr:uncharacterized protein LOC133520968 [Cydia pomonella]
MGAIFAVLYAGQQAYNEINELRRAMARLYNALLRSKSNTCYTSSLTTTALVSCYFSILFKKKTGHVRVSYTRAPRVAPEQTSNYPVYRAIFGLSYFVPVKKLVFTGILSKLFIFYEVPGPDALQLQKTVKIFHGQMALDPIKIKIMSVMPVQMALVLQILSTIVSYTIIFLQFNHVV